MKFTRLLIASLTLAGLMYGCTDDSGSNSSAIALVPEDTAELCADGLDNDNNGVKDCDEESCKGFDNCKSAEKQCPADMPEGKKECTCDKTTGTWINCQDDIPGEIECPASMPEGKKECSCDKTTGSWINCHDDIKTEICDNDIDDDGDDKTDCADEDCAEASNCKSNVPAEDTEERCTDGEDNDNNGKTDCEEDSCKDFLKCVYEAQDAHIAQCLNEKDDDGDGKKDCADDDCKDMFPSGCPRTGVVKEIYKSYCDTDNHLTIYNESGEIVGSETCTYECKEPPCCDEGRCKTCEDDYGDKKFCDNGNLSYCKDGQLVSDKCEFGCFENASAPNVTPHCNKCQPLLSVCKTVDLGPKSKEYAVACEPKLVGSDTHPTLAGFTRTEAECPDGCEDGYCKEFCATQLDAPGECVSNNVRRTCKSNEYKYETCEFGCNTKTGQCNNCYDGAIQCSSDGSKLQICENTKWVDQETCTNGCQSGFCLNDDKTINGMKPEVAPDFSKAKDCIKDSECASDEFCDSFLGKCSIRCTDDAECIDGYKCRPDGRCASDTFHIAMEACNRIIELPTKYAKKCNFTVYWGDSENSSDTITSCGEENLYHIYPENTRINEVYSIRIVGEFDGFSIYELYMDKSSKTNSCFTPDDMRIYYYGTPLRAIYTFGPVGLGSGAFFSWTSRNWCELHPSLPIHLAQNDIPDATLMTDMHDMFTCYKSGFEAISKWDVSHVTNMSGLFRAYDTKSCSIIPDLSRWDVSNVTDMSHMFAMATINLDSIGLENWNVSNVTNMQSMFLGLSVNTSFSDDISNWNVANVTDMSYMFALSSYYPNISNWKVNKVTDMSYMFAETSYNPNISNWDVSNVTDMSHMFAGNFLFNQNIGNWNVSNVTNMNDMFYQATEFNQDISDWDVSKVKRMSYMFGTARSSLLHGHVWEEPPVVNFNQDISNWALDSLEDAYGMFKDNKVFNQDLSGWVLPKIKSLSAMYKGASAYSKAFTSLPKPEANLTCYDLMDVYTGTAVSCEDVKKLIELWNIKCSEFANAVNILKSECE